MTTRLYACNRKHLRKLVETIERLIGNDYNEAIRLLRSEYDDLLRNLDWKEYMEEQISSFTKELIKRSWTHHRLKRLSELGEEKRDNLVLVLDKNFRSHSTLGGVETLHGSTQRLVSCQSQQTPNIIKQASIIIPETQQIDSSQASNKTKIDSTMRGIEAKLSTRRKRVLPSLTNNTSNHLSTSKNYRRSIDSKEWSDRSPLQSTHINNIAPLPHPFCYHKTDNSVVMCTLNHADDIIIRSNHPHHSSHRTQRVQKGSARITTLESCENQGDDKLSPLRLSHSTFIRVSGDNSKICTSELNKETMDYQSSFDAAVAANYLLHSLSEDDLRMFLHCMEPLLKE
jgi:hypothetical protein